ncbi:hypothetical protein EJ04DRAFT_511368 [Polyplosphaeria fusca]|uniref:Uncharacterized protein n=1 Tax=Polyplosphaeria fusca TaxID=682080 RepID=A0A9P4R0L4_9PLEO|nr:hypothetical protein EJ04DRAFT_511368 [Polyplosphaeria fusca]
MAQHPYNLRPERTIGQVLATPTSPSGSTQTIVPSTPIPPPVTAQPPRDPIANQPPPVHAPAPIPAPTPESLEELRRQNEAEQITHDREMRALQLQEIRERIRMQQKATGAVVEDDEAAQGEQYSPEVLNLMNKLPGASPKDLSEIVRHKFNPWNLARLRTGIGQRHLDQHDVTRIDSVTQQLVLKRSVGSAKDFGSDSSIWLESFTNYTRIVAIVWGKKHPEAVPAMLSFISFVIRQSLSYDWSSVLSFAIAFHSRACGTNILDPTQWEPVPEAWVSHYFNAATLSSKRLRRNDSGGSRSRARRSLSPKSSQPNDKTVICENFNKSKGCNFWGCNRRHECRKCKSTSHGESACSK